MQGSALALGAATDPTIVTPPSISRVQHATPMIETAFAFFPTFGFSFTVIFTTSLPPN